MRHKYVQLFLALFLILVTVQAGILDHVDLQLLLCHQVAPRNWLQQVAVGVCRGGATRTYQWVI